MFKKIITVISVLLFLASYFVNAGMMVDSSPSMVNVIYSVVCLVCFALVLILMREDKRVLIGSCIFWGIALACAIVTVVSIMTNVELGVLWICVLVCLSPYYGICSVLREAAFSSNQPMLLGYESSLLIVPLAFIVLITILLYREKKTGVLPLDTSVPFIKKT